MINLATDISNRYGVTREEALEIVCKVTSYVLQDLKVGINAVKPCQKPFSSHRRTPRPYSTK